MASLRFTKNLPGLSILVIIGLLGTSCDSLNSLFPDTYQEEEYEMSDIDYRACLLLTRADKDSLGNTQTITVKSIYDAVAAAYDTLTADSTNASVAAINAAHDGLLVVCAAVILPTDTSIKLVPPVPVEDGNSRSFAIYTPEASGGGEITVIFFLNDYVNLEVMDRDGTAMERSSESITYEAFGGCTEVIELGPESYEYEPQMKLRYAYRLSSSTTYLMRLTLMETYSQAANFRVVVLETAS